MSTGDTTLRAARVFMGVMYAAGAVFNLSYTSTHPDFLGDWADTALIGLQASFVREVAVPYVVPFAIVVAAYELLMAYLLVSGRRNARYGHMMGMAFNVAVAPLWIVQVFLNGALAIIHALLLVAESRSSTREPAKALRA